MEFETLEVKVPRELLIGIEKKKFVQDMKLFTAMKLYEMNTLSFGKAAELAGKNKEEFMEALSEHGIDVIRYSKEELNEEIKFLKEIKGIK
jgi:predicted HTH domain antitoxin